MKRFFLLFIFSLLTFSSCYNPQLNDEPFVCGGSHGEGTCPEGYGCYGGICMDSPPACWQDNFFGLIGGNDDVDFEPNNTPDLAYMLNCGDTPDKNALNCPTRFDITRTYQDLAICGEGDIDIYKIYLTAGETIELTLRYNYSAGHDLDMVLFHSTIDPATGSMNYNLSSPDQQSVSNNDDEEISHTASVTGWYYVMVYGSTINDINGYALQWILLSDQGTN